MKKIILVLLISFTALLADYVITKDGTLTLQTTQSTTTPPPADEGTITPPPVDEWVETSLPTKAFNVLNYGLKGDGVTDDSAALNTLAANTDVTNWYFPANKTFRLYRVNIPSHVTAVYGGGTIMSISTSGTGYEYGGLYTRSAHSNLVIDGLNFKGESGYVGNQYYGQLQLNSDGDNTNNTQIRNCHFDGALRASNLIRVFARIDAAGGDHTNLRIYNNTFINGEYFAMELYNNTTDGDIADDMEGLRNLRIYDNNVGNGTGWGIGIGKIRTSSYIYNNTLNTDNRPIEIILSNNNHTYNNTAIAKQSVLEEGVIHKKSQYLTPGVNYIHHNHLTGLQVLLYFGSNSEVYENFIHARLWIEARGGDRFFGNIHDNTIVSSSSKPVKIEDMDDPKGGKFSNNNIYGRTSYTDTYGIRFTGSVPSSGVEIRNNNIYQEKSPNYCIEAGGTQSGNTCTLNYNGQIPTKR